MKFVLARPTFFVVCFLLVGLSRPAFAEVPTLDQSEALRLSQAAIGRQFADLTLVDRRERSFKLSAYRGQPLLVKKQVALTGDRLTDAQAGFDNQTQEPAVHLTLDSAG